MTTESARFSARQLIGFPLGLALWGVVLLLPTPASLSTSAHHAGALAVLMAAWWITECVPIAVTALVPLATYPTFGVLNMDETASQYGSPVVFLMMGGFMIALAMQRWQLHRRLALIVLSRTGTGAAALLGGFMLVSAVLSMWVSNTATAVMLLPIGIAVLSQLPDSLKAASGKVRFEEALMLGIAYSASIGGVATLIGSPPNLIFAGQAHALFPNYPPIRFVQWFLFGFPLAAMFLICAWLYLAWISGSWKRRRDSSTAKLFKTQLQALGRWSAAERTVATVFCLTALAWIFRADIPIGPFTITGWSTLLGAPGVQDSTIAIFAAVALFAIPLNLRRGEFVLNWETASKLPWDVVLLMGGGFALAESFRVTGLAQWLGEHLALLQGLPIPVAVLLICLMVTFLTEVTSNTATAVVLMPILAAASVTLGMHPYLLMIPATISASFAFMLPVATPPNAIVFGSGHVRVHDMARAGLFLNLLGALLTTAAMLLWGRGVFEI